MICRFLKAYQAPMHKFIFPYAYLDDLKKLDETALPPINAFHNRLRGEKMTQEKYQGIKTVWETEGFSTLKDMLVYYMYHDTVPALHAMEKMKQFWASKEICMLKVKV